MGYKRYEQTRVGKVAKSLFVKPLAVSCYSTAIRHGDTIVGVELINKAAKSRESEVVVINISKISKVSRIACYSEI